MELMLLGAAAMTSFTISVFFLKFWRTTRDRFFLFFAVSFLLDAISRVILGLKQYSSEQEPLFYIIRLVAFLLIVMAIIDKNWLRPRRQ